MGVREDARSFFFSLYIANAGPYWGEPFRRVADLEFDRPEHAHESATNRGWAMGAFMVRTGLHLCEQRDPGLYHGFLVALTGFVLEEADYIDMAGERSCFTRWFRDDSFMPSGTANNPFMVMAHGILAERIVDEPRAVAFSLIVEGLQFCQEFAPERFSGLLLAVTDLCLKETDRVEGSAWRIPPRTMEPARLTLRLLTAEFNACVAGPFANARAT